MANHNQTVKTKTEKRNDARKQAEAQKAARKAMRQAKGNLIMGGGAAKKGKSIVPQSKTRKQK